MLRVLLLKRMVEFRLKKLEVLFLVYLEVDGVVGVKYIVVRLFFLFEEIESDWE